MNRVLSECKKREKFNHLLDLTLKNESLDENTIENAELPNIEISNLVQIVNFLVDNITEEGKGVFWIHITT